MRGFIDLHMHSIYSDDGEFTPTELVRQCKEAGLRMIAISDHNCVKANAEAQKEAERLNILYIPAVEIDCSYNGVNLHVLGYQIDYTSINFDHLEENIRQQGLEASKERLKLTRQLGFHVTEDELNALLDNGYWNTWTGEIFAEVLLNKPEYQENELLKPYRTGGERSDNPYVNFYWDYYAQGKPCYVNIEYPSLKEAISLIRKNGGKSVLAHPGINLMENPSMLDEIIALGIDGIEAFSSYHDEVTSSYYYKEARKHSLLITCGSDYHGKTKPAIRLGESGCFIDEKDIEQQFALMKAGIVGLGLIGGSLAKIFKKIGGIEIVAYNRREEPLQAALSDGVCDQVTTEIDQKFADCDIIFICTTVNSICDFVEKLRPIVKNDCIITDVGSTKKNIVEKIRRLDQLNFIGGHPMTGSEKTGYQAARAYLFENAYYVLTPLPWVKQEKIDFIKTLVQKTGAIPIVMTPENHDRAVAAISHLPHVVASTLVSMVEASDNEEKNLHTLAAGGFRDLTRVASGSPALWSSICLENRAEIINALTHFQDSLQSFKTILSQGGEKELSDFFLAAKQYRDSFHYRLAGAYSDYAIKVDIMDLPGSIAKISTLLSGAHINIKNIGIINNRDFESGIMQILLDNQSSLEKSIALLREEGFSVYYEE